MSSPELIRSFSAIDLDTPQHEPFLLRLPTEIRLKIFRHVFEEVRYVTFCSCPPNAVKNTCRSRSKLSQYTGPALFLVCKRFQQEAESVFYAESILRIGHRGPNDELPVSDKTLSRINILGTSASTINQKIHPDLYDQEGVLRLERIFPNLKALVVRAKGRAKGFKPGHEWVKYPWHKAQLPYRLWIHFEGRVKMSDTQFYPKGHGLSLEIMFCGSRVFLVILNYMSTEKRKLRTPWAAEIRDDWDEVISNFLEMFELKPDDVLIDYT